MAGIAEIATKLASEYNITVSSAKTMLVTVMDTIYEAAKTERVSIGRHIFKPYVRAARNGRNPKTGEAIVIGEKKGVKYKCTSDKTEKAAAPVKKKAAAKKPKK